MYSIRRKGASTGWTLPPVRIAAPLRSWAAPSSQRSSVKTMSGSTAVCRGCASSGRERSAKAPNAAIFASKRYKDYFWSQAQDTPFQHKKNSHPVGWLFFLMDDTRLELVLAGLRPVSTLIRALRALKIVTSSSATLSAKRSTPPFGGVLRFGGRYKTRTCDLPHVKRMRYQLRQSSVALSAWSFYSIPLRLSSFFSSFTAFREDARRYIGGHNS